MQVLMSFKVLTHLENITLALVETIDRKRGIEEAMEVDLERDGMLVTNMLIQRDVDLSEEYFEDTFGFRWK